VPKKIYLLTGVASLIAAFTAAGVSAQSDAGMLHITDTVSYEAGSAQAGKIQAWLEGISPGEGSVPLRGKVTVINAYPVSRAVANRSGLQSLGPTAALPKTGDPGQHVSIKDELPDGTRQSWTYAWRGDPVGTGWEMTHYQFHQGRPRTQVD